MAAAAGCIGAGVASAQSGGAVAPGGTPPPPSSSPYPYIFPVAGPHTYGDGFGRGRAGGRNHQGVDVMAKCGTPLLAVSKSRVTIRKKHGRAGHYVVLRDKKSKIDLVYAHLRRPAVVRKRQKVKPGQWIGAVGRTGNASACHLHFEMWRKGAYRGKPLNPMRSLLAWDSYS